MNPTNPDQQLIMGKPAQFWIIFGAVVTVLFVLGATFAANALVSISYSFGDQARKGDVKLQILNSKGEQKDIGLLGNLALIPRDTQAIIAKTDNSNTSQHISDLPFFGIPGYNLTLQPQHQLSKVGAETLGCNLQNEFGLFTYNCTTISNVNQINRPDNGVWDTSPVESGRTEVIFSRYKSGFLALDAKTVEYLIPGKATQLYALPSDFLKDGDNIELVTDPNSADTGFVVANYTQGTFLWVEDFKPTARKVSFRRAADTNPQFNISLCAMNSTQLSCYYGPDSHDHDNTEESAKYRTEHKIGSVEITSLQNTSDSKVYRFDSLSHADQIYQTTAGPYATSENKLYQLTVGADRVNASLIATNVAAVATTDSSLFYTTDADQLFEYDEKSQTATMRFHSSNLRSLDLSTYGGTVLINAFINADSTGDVGNVAHVYQLTDNILPDGAVRKEDKLPYKDNTSPISYLDYSDTAFYVSLEQVFTTDPQTGIRNIDTVATNTLRTQALQKLTDDGFITATTKVLFAN